MLPVQSHCSWNGRMRPIRYRLSTLLILLTLIAFAISWVSWPWRSAEAYVNDHFRNRIEMENPFVEGSLEHSKFEKSKAQLLERERVRISNLKLIAHRRSVADIIAGRQTFDFGMVEFTICRGQLVSGPKPFFQSGARYYR